LIDNRSLFDAYSFDTAHDMTDHGFGFLTTFLRQVLKASAKPVWVFWSICSCEHSVDNFGKLSTSDWQPPRQKTGVAKSMQMYKAVESLTRRAATWFYTGVCQDFYEPRKHLSDLQWEPYWVEKADIITDSWNSRHFAGLLDHKGEVKKGVLSTIKKLHESS
jgi:hypothetical protein